jgi:flagellar basal-body rod protein FlgF
MSDVADLALSAISQAQRRVEIAAQNLANVTTPGYKRRIAFSSLLRSPVPNDDAMPIVNTAIDHQTGKVTRTGSPTDLAIAGPGYFAMRAHDGVIYTRQGQFTRDREGRLVNAQGAALQLTDGNDVIVKSAAFEVRRDGTVIENGERVGQIAVFVPHDEKAVQEITGGFREGSAAFERVGDAVIQQGMIEASNVSSGDEMVGMMEAMRRAEAGQRVMSVYDDLMGRVITSFGDSVR